ncbi:putative holin-like toxin [Alicyclobacillus dauci]
MGVASPLRRGGEALLTVFQTLTLMISFATLIVPLLAVNRRK